MQAQLAPYLGEQLSAFALDAQQWVQVDGARGFGRRGQASPLDFEPRLLCSVERLERGRDKQQTLWRTGSTRHNGFPDAL
jgi:hypothetical protein